MDHFNERGDASVDADFMTTTKPKPKKPSLYGVVILNDDFTPMQFVVMILVKVFNLALEDATRVMFRVHKEGRAKVGSFTAEVAETKATLVIDIAIKNEHPLQAYAEPI
jgi:ATP-dependent Clp protease adaptor protein ClpS